MSAPPARNSVEEQRRRAQLAVKAGQYGFADRQLRALLAHRPADAASHWLLGVTQLEQGEIGEAIAILQQLLSRQPEFAEARVDLARAYRSAGRTEQAREEVRTVLQKLPQLHRAWLAYGDVLVDLAQYDDARIAFERAQRTDPRLARVEQATAALVADDRRRVVEASSRAWVGWTNSADDCRDAFRCLDDLFERR